MKPACDARRFGYLSGSRSAASGLAGTEGSDGSVSHEGAVFLGLMPGSGSPIFAADLGPELPLWPDSSAALQAIANTPAFDGLRDGAAAGEGGDACGTNLMADDLRRRRQLHALQEATDTAAAGTAATSQAAGQQLEVRAAALQHCVCCPAPPSHPCFGQYRWLGVMHLHMPCAAPTGMGRGAGV